MALTEELHIDCPSTTAFDLMADARNETRWNGSVSRAELTTDEPVGKGSQFIVVNRGREDEATITGFDRPEHLEFAVTSKSMDIAITYTFAETDGKTTAVGNFDAQPKGVMKALLSLLMPVIRRDLASNTPTSRSSARRRRNRQRHSFVPRCVSRWREGRNEPHHATYRRAIDVTPLVVAA